MNVKTKKAKKQANVENQANNLLPKEELDRIDTKILEQYYKTRGGIL